MSPFVSSTCEARSRIGTSVRPRGCKANCLTVLFVFRNILAHGLIKVADHTARSSEPLVAPQSGAAIVTAGGIILAIGGLYYGRDIFIPFALAILLAFALAPIVNWLRRLRLPRVPAVMIVVVSAIIAIGGISYVVAMQLIKLGREIPSYQQTMVEKIQALELSGTGGGFVNRITTTIEDLGKEFSGEKPEELNGALEEGRKSRQPVPVTVLPPSRTPLEVLQTVVGPLIRPLAIAGIVIVFVIFVLLERDDLRDRFIKLVGAGDLRQSTRGLEEAANKVSSYLLTQLLVNVSYGVPIGIGLYLIGVPSAVLWGVLAAVLRFVPFLGPVLAALFPLILAFAIDPGWTMLLWVIGLFVVMEIISGNVIEPLAYGTSTGLSSLSIIVAAIFWTTLWGPIGLVLATPLTVCLSVIGRYVPRLHFLGTLLGSSQVLTTEERFYQRLLAGNAEDAVEIGEDFVDRHSSMEFYDQVAVPALRLAETDRQRSIDDVGVRRRLAEDVIAVVREVSDHAYGQQQSSCDDRPLRSIRAVGEPVLCLGGRTELDLAAAEIIARALEERRIGACVLPPVRVSQNAIKQLDFRGVEVVCLAYSSPTPHSSVRFVCRRIKRHAPDVKTLVWLWNSLPETDQATLREQISSDSIALSADAAATQIDAWVARHISNPMMAAPQTENEEDRMLAIRELGLLSSESKFFDNIAAKVAAAFDTAIALVTVIDETHQHWPGAAGLPEKLNVCRMSDRETSICGHVIAEKDVLVIEDVAKDPRFANNPFLLENGIRFYAGAPLRTSAGTTLGSLCVIDLKPRSFSLEDRRTLQEIARHLMIKVESECHRRRSHESFDTVLSAQIPSEFRRLLSQTS